MTEKVTWQQKLKGAFDLLFLFGRGIDPFEKQNNKTDGIKSLWIPVVLFPLGLIGAWLRPPAGLETVPRLNCVLTVAAQGIIGTVAGIGILWMAAVMMDRRNRFWIPFQAFNWVGLPLAIICVPFLILALMGWYPREIMDRVFTVFLYYSFIVGACIYYRGLKISWELAGFFACLGILVGQLTQNALFTLNGVPIR